MSKSLNRLKIFTFLILVLSSLQVKANLSSSKQWKILVYMQADNDLAPYALWDLAEISSGLSKNEQAKVFVEIDLPGSNGSQRIEVLPSDKAIGQNLDYFQHSDLGQIKHHTILDIAEEVAQEKKLYEFVQWAQSYYPTDYTLLAIWGHGEGWSYSRLAQFGGIAIDDNPSSRLNTKKISQILRRVEAQTGEKINFLAMDACLMQTAEVALEFSEVVDYVSGSTQIQNFRGLPYHKILENIDNLSPYELANNLSKIYISELATYASVKEKQKATISVIHTHELNQQFVYPFNKAIRALSELIQQKPLYKMLLAQKLKDAPSFLGNSRDLYNFIGIIMQFLHDNGEDGLYAQFNMALNGLDRSIISYGYGEYYLKYHGYFLGFFKAFGVWFPANNNDFANRYKLFEQSRFYQQMPAWGDFLYQIFRPIKPILPFWD